MKISDVLVLLAAGTLGGIFSTVVSIASLVTYPVLLALGVPPLSANMTNTVSLVLTGAGSVAGSRPELEGQGRRVLRFGAITALGGAAGAAVLLAAPAGSFALVVPFLIAGASVVLLVQPALRKRAEEPEPTREPSLARRAALFAVAMYVGYFGAAAGIMLLVVLVLHDRRIAGQGERHQERRLRDGECHGRGDASHCSATSGGRWWSRSRRASW